MSAFTTIQPIQIGDYVVKKTKPGYPSQLMQVVDLTETAAQVKSLTRGRTERILIAKLELAKKSSPPPGSVTIAFNNNLVHIPKDCYATVLNGHLFIRFGDREVQVPNPESFNVASQLKRQGVNVIFKGRRSAR